ncbi:MAG: hypothetical protein OEX01_05375 [Candidatus Bathyarchaeota archaeon]|nr:hypothetical protein [Candidatus Bathyarchaeota archaeon]
MCVLDHKNIKKSLIYRQLATFEDDEYLYKTAANVEEARKLIKIGYEYVYDVENMKLFRKRK